MNGISPVVKKISLKRIRKLLGRFRETVREVLKTAFFEEKDF